MFKVANTLNDPHLVCMIQMSLMRVSQEVDGACIQGCGE